MAAFARKGPSLPGMVLPEQAMMSMQSLHLYCAHSGSGLHAACGVDSIAKETETRHPASDDAAGHWPTVDANAKINWAVRACGHTPT